MTNSTFNLLSSTSRIGITPTADEIRTETSQEYYIDEQPKKLTRANSFMILDEVFIIRKKDYQGKASKLFHVFRESDGRLVASIPVIDKDKAIKLVREKYVAMDL